MYATVIRWCMQEFERLINQYKSLLPSYTKRENIPHLLWIMPSRNKYYHNDESRYKFGQQLKELSRTFKGQTALELVQLWEYGNANLVLQEQRRLTMQGKCIIWRAIDRTIRFCDGNKIRLSKKMPYDQENYIAKQQAAREDRSNEKLPKNKRSKPSATFVPRRLFQNRDSGDENPENKNDRVRLPTPPPRS